MNRTIEHFIEVDRINGEFLVLHPNGQIVLKLSRKDAQAEVNRYAKRSVKPDDVVISKIHWRIRS